MDNLNQVQDNKSYKIIIWTLSAVIPLAVAVLLFLPQKLSLGDWVYNLPGFHAILNSLTAIVLILGLIFIKQNNIKLHRLMMTIAFVLGSIFLVSYVLYHSSAGSTYYGDIDGSGVVEEIEMTEDYQFWKPIYLLILLSHIGLAVVVVPLVLFAIYFAISNNIERHKKIVKFTFPIWLYVSITGVVVYWMISPFYIH